jgi:hypothetical protein
VSYLDANPNLGQIQPLRSSGGEASHIEIRDNYCQADVCVEGWEAGFRTQIRTCMPHTAGAVSHSVLVLVDVPASLLRRWPQLAELKL